MNTFGLNRSLNTFQLGAIGAVVAIIRRVFKRGLVITKVWRKTLER